MDSGTGTSLEFLAGGGEMGELIRAKDWSQTPLGPPESWPPSLRIAVSIMLDTHFGMHIAWGEEYIQLYNDGYRPVLGQTKHPAALGLPIRDSFPEIWEDFVRPKFAEVLRGKPFGAENLLVPQDRNHYLEESYFTFSYSPIRDEHGRVGGVLTTEAETTEHVIRERRLQTSRNVANRSSTVATSEEAGRALMQVLGENTYDVPFALLYVLDAGGAEARLTECVRLDEHPVARPERLGVAAETAWPLADVLTNDTPQLLTDLPTRFGPLPGGAWPEPTHSAYLLPIRRLDRKQPYGVLVLGINPRKAFDAPHREFFESLGEQATRVFATVSALEEERRRVEALREIDRAKTLFFSNVSHEFRTPLTLMLGPLEEALNANGQLPAPVHENLETAHRNALRLQKLVNSLLDFSRIEAGRLRASYAPTDLADLTADLASNFRSVIERAGMVLVVDCPPLPEPVFVDREMWEKIVLNLLSNAFKYTLDGEIAVRLSAEDGQAVLRVRDSGVGIPADELPRLFERFHRVAGSRGRSFEGTGIGLSLIKELVGLHGGSIEAESRPGLGSTFTVRIPLGKAHLPGEATEAPAVPKGGASLLFQSISAELPASAERGSNVASPSGAGEAFGTAHVVVADDNADMRAYVQRLLEPHYRVSLAPDGQVARWLVAEHQPDLVLSDVMMPVMDGFALLKTLKDDPQTAHIPVVLLSARAGEEATIEGYEAGADDYLVKPFSANELLARVRAQLNLARLRREAERKLGNLFELAPVGIALLRGPELTFELANEFYVTLVGRQRADQLVGKPLLEALPEITSQGYFDLMTRVMQTGEPMVFTEQPVQFSRNGQLETVYLNFNFEALPAPDAGVFVLIAEVTDSVLARQKIEENEERLRLAIETAELGTWDFDPQTGVIQCPERTVELFGFAPGAAVTLELALNAVVDADRPRVAEAIAHALQPESGGRYDVEYSLVNYTDGQRRTIQARGQAFFDENGVAHRFTGTARDVTEQRRAEANLAFLAALMADFARLSTAREIMEAAGRRIAGFLTLSHCAFSEIDETATKARVFYDHHPAGLPSLVGEYRVDDFHSEAELRELKAGRPSVINDARRDRAPEQAAAFAALGFAALVDASYVGNGRWYFSLSVARKEPCAWRSDEIALVQELAARVYLRLERAHAEAALRESEEKFRTLFESMDEGFCIIEFLDGPHGPLSDYVHVEANPAYARHAGIPDVVGQQLRTMVPDEADDWIARYRPVLETGRPTHFEQELVATGRHLALAAFRIEPPERRQVAVLFTDVTDRKRAEAALSESNRWFRQLADSMPQIVWTARPDGYLDYYNRRWYEFIDNDLGFGDAGWLPILHPDDRQPCLDHWQRCLQTGEPYQFEFRLDDVRQPGNYRWYLALATAFRDADGSILKWMGTCTNIHDQKTEAERLEKLVQERTEALGQANADLQRSNLNLTQFAYVASHDLQEPLRKIRAFGDMLLRRNADRLDESGADRIRRMQEAASRMNDLIQDLLAYSRVSTRQDAFQPVNLNDLLTSVRSDLELVIREKAATLRAEPLPTVQGDATQLRQVLQNLISNALKFSKPGVPPVVDVRHRTVPGAEAAGPGLALQPSARYHEISVSDNGIGFDEQFADRIFEAFQRLHGRADYAGTGIGLAIVKKVAENHHGGVAVSSREGEGSAFRVYLPAGIGD